MQQNIHERSSSRSDENTIPQDWAQGNIVFRNLRDVGFYFHNRLDGEQSNIRPTH
ncbi:MAG: hypothetical protein Q7J80_06545 [Anaerolineales bacterium]|nr:hypothetical protein [Anaerolineales bacterium]